MPKRKISIIGSTGSIGRQALEVLEYLQDKFEITALAGGLNTDLLLEQAEKFRPKYVSSDKYDVRLGKINGCKYLVNGLEEICSKKDENDMLLNGVKDEALRENSSPESKVIHRKRYINKLLGIVKDPEVLSKYKELTENRINKIHYLNPNRSTPYIEESPEKLLLILAETDALHQQILTDLASQDKYNKNRR